MKLGFLFVGVNIAAFTLIAASTGLTRVDPPPAPLVHDVWIVASRPDGNPGSGTLFDPYDGSTAEKFDAILRSIPENATIHLGPGTFLTNGYQDYSIATKGFYVKKGWQVLGSGRDITTVKLMSLLDRPPGYSPYNGVAFCTGIGGGDGSNSMVADLTVDCNASNLSTGTANGTDYKVGAIGLGGNNCVIRNVHAIHAYGKFDPAADFECFTLVVSNFYDTSGVWQTVTNGVIEDCVVDNSSPELGVAIMISGANSGVIRRNTIKDWGGTCVFQVYASNILVEDNTTDNCAEFFYIDTGSSDHVTFRNNIAIGLTHEMFDFDPSPGAGALDHDMIVENNTALMSGTGAFFGVSGQQSGHAWNFTVRNNTVASAYHAIYLDHVDNISVYGNDFEGIKAAYPFGSDVTHLNFLDETIDSSFVGALKFTGTYSSGGYANYSYPGTYTIAPGDQLKYEVFCDPSNASFQPDGFLVFSDSTTTQHATDQWGIPLATDMFTSPHVLPDVRGHAMGKWYARDIDLTAYAGKTTSDFRFGDTSWIAGVNTHYWRDIRIEDQLGVVKSYFYTNGSGAPTYQFSGNVSSYSAGPINVVEYFAQADAGNLTGTQSFADGARGTFDFSTVRTDPGGLLNTATDHITSPATGTMVIKWNCALDTVTSAGFVDVEISKNGSPIAFTYVANPEKQTYSVIVTDASAAGDYYICTLYNSTGEPVLVSQNYLETFVEAQFYPGLTL
jgi:hypothetical protein